MLTQVFAFLTLSALPLLLNAQNTFYQPDEFACVGKTVEMKCYIQAPSSEIFSISVPLVSFDGSDPYTMDQINSNNVPNRDTSRYDIEQITTGNTHIGASITISSFEATDSDILFGCHGQYFNGTDTEALASGYPPKTPAPPYKPWTPDVKVISVSYGCFAEISISFIYGSSDAPIQYYKMYVNGELSEDHLDNSTSFFNPALVSFYVVPATTYKISVAAVSCAGTSPVSDIDGGNTFSIPSFDLDSSFYFTLDYFNGLVINWSFQDKSDIAIAIGYNLKVDTSFLINGESYTLNQTQTFSQTSALTSYTHDLGLSVITENEIHLAITVRLGIVSQCYDSTYSGNTITTTDADLVSKVAFVNIPTSKSWVAIVALSLGLLLCSVSNVTSILVAINESFRRRSALRKQNYTQLVPANELGEPLINREVHTFPGPIAPVYSVNTLGHVPSYGEMSGVKM